MSTSNRPLGNNGQIRSDLLQQVVEAVVFSASEPVSAERISRLVAEVTGGEGPGAEAVDAVVTQLNATWKKTERPLRIERWGGGYRMATSEAIAPYLQAFFQDEPRQRLSRSLMETLAVVAYRQPVTKPEVDYVRGVDSGYGVRKLLELKLIDVAGRSEAVGRPLLYGTTDKFLEQFGLASMEELPQLREIEELLDDPQFNREKAKLLISEGIIPPEDPDENQDESDGSPTNGVDPEAERSV